MILKKLFRNEQGLSLAELLATLAIGSLFIILIMSIHILIQKQYNSQSEDIKRLTDVTIAVTSITKDIRAFDVTEVSGDTITFESGDGELVTYVFNKDNKVLQKNDTNYIYGIKHFNVTQEDQRIILEIVSESGKEINTTIMLREETESDE